MKKRIVLLLAAGVLATLTACASADTASTQEAPAAAEETAEDISEDAETEAAVS